MIKRHLELVFTNVTGGGSGGGGGKQRSIYDPPTGTGLMTCSQYDGAPVELTQFIETMASSGGVDFTKLSARDRMMSLHIPSSCAGHVRFC